MYCKIYKSNSKKKIVYHIFDKLVSLGLIYLTFHTTLIGKDPFAPTCILTRNHEWSRMHEEVSTMIPSCSTLIYWSPPISTKNPLWIYKKFNMKSANNPLCTHSNENGPLNEYGWVVWISSSLVGLIWVELHSELGLSFWIVRVSTYFFLFTFA
jgi:hypothetical protein